VLAKIGYATVTPIFSLAVMNSFACLGFCILMICQKRWQELRVKEAYLYIIGNALLSGFLYYILVFIGTQKSSAGNASIILLLEVLFAILILKGKKGERISTRELCGAFLMVIAAAIVGFPEKWVFNSGDILIGLAGIPAVFANICSKQARLHISAVTIMFVRTIIVSLLFWLTTLLFSSMPSLDATFRSLPALFINGFFVIGISRILWIEAINLMPISKANALSSAAPFFTLLAAYFLLGEEPTIRQLTAIVPMVIGLNLLIRTSAVRKQVEVQVE
jgi:drug/metabolite transporter (DMT)-like permease